MPTIDRRRALMTMAVVAGQPWACIDSGRSAAIDPLDDDAAPDAGARDADVPVDGGALDQHPDEPPDALVDGAAPGIEVIRGGNLMAGVHGMSMNRDGVLYVADTFARAGRGSRIYRYAPPYDAPAETRWTGSRVAGLMALGDLVWACDVGANEARLLPDVRTLDIVSPWNVGTTGAEFVFVTDGGQVLSQSGGEGSMQPFIVGLQAPFDVVGDPDGGVWVSEQVSEADDGRVALWSADGQMVREIVHPWRNPEGLTIDHRGALWVADTGAGEVLRFDRATGELLRRIDMPGLPIVMTTDPTTDDVLVSITGDDPSWWRIRVP